MCDRPRSHHASPTSRIVLLSTTLLKLKLLNIKRTPEPCTGNSRLGIASTTTASIRCLTSTLRTEPRCTLVHDHVVELVDGDVTAIDDEGKGPLFKLLPQPLGPPSAYFVLGLDRLGIPVAKVEGGTREMGRLKPAALHL